MKKVIALLALIILVVLGSYLLLSREAATPAPAKPETVELIDPMSQVEAIQNSENDRTNLLKAIELRDASYCSQIENYALRTQCQDKLGN